MDIAGKVEKNCIEYSKKINELLTEMKLENNDINLFFRKFCNFLNEFREDLKKFNGKENIAYFSTKFRVIFELAEYIYFILRDDNCLDGKIDIYKLNGEMKKYKIIEEFEIIVKKNRNYDSKEFNDEMNKQKEIINIIYRRLKTNKNFIFEYKELGIENKDQLVENLDEKEINYLFKKNWYSICSANKTMKDLIFDNEKYFYEKNDKSILEKLKIKKITKEKIKDISKEINIIIKSNNNFENEIKNNNFDFKKINEIKLSDNIFTLAKDFVTQTGNILKIEKMEKKDFLTNDQKLIFECIEPYLLSSLQKYNTYSLLSKSVHVGNIFDDEKEEEARTLSLSYNSFTISFDQLIQQMILNSENDMKEIVEKIRLFLQWRELLKNS